jgi:hypothetical protein
MTSIRPLCSPLIPDGHRVRYCLGKWFSGRDAALRTLAADWTSRPWASQRDGTVQPRAIAREWGLFDIPADANVVWFDGDYRPTWVRSSVLDDIGFAPKAAPGGSQLEITFA